MRSFGALVFAFFVSTFFAGVVQNRLAVAFGAREEFIAIMMLFVLAAITAIVVFGIALGASTSVAGVDRTALALMVLTVLALGGLVAAAAATDRKLSVNAQDAALLTEIGVPTALMIVIQWWFVRRRWRKAHAAA